MSAMTTNTASDDTLIRDSQLSGFGAFRERLGLCCCRLLKKSHTYDLSSVSKDTEELPDKPAYVNQAFQREKQARKEKLDKIARTLPNATPNSVVRPPTRPLTTVTPRSNVGTAQTRTPMNTSNSKVGISSISRPSPGNSNTKKDSDETSSEDSSEEESSSEDDQSSDSDRPAAKKSPIKAPPKRR